MESEAVVCPKCNSSEVDYISRRGGYVCAACSYFFKSESSTELLRIFLSYGHDDKAFISARLKTEFEALGHEVWYDGDRLQCRMDWESYIERGLEWVAEVGSRGRFLLLMTPHSIRRPDGFCLNELTRAMERQISVFPVMVEWCEPPLSICRLQWLDFRVIHNDGQFTERFPSAFNELNSALVSNKNDFDGSLQRLRAILDPVAFEASTLTHLRRFVGRRWVVDSIEHWLENEDGDKVFWVVGGPGSGKSALASWLQYNRPYVKSFFLCKAASTGSGGIGIYEPGDPRWCVRTIAYQLSSMLPDYRDRLVRLDLERITKENSAESLFEKLITEELYGIQFEQPGRMVALIDGLDEVTKEGRNDLVELLVKHLPNTPDWLRFVITSRYEEPLIGAMQRYQPFSIDDEALNAQDHMDFIAKEFEPFRNADRIDEKIAGQIIRKSEGNFLYLEQLRDSLQKGYLSLENIDSFPQGLGEFYRLYFTRKFTDIREFRDYYYSKLGIMVAVSVPLSIEEAESLFGWHEGYEIKDFKNFFGALCRYDSDRIRLFHQSLVEWITDEEKAGDFWVRVEKGYEYIAREGYAVFKSGRRDLNPGESKCIRELPECLVNLGDYQRLYDFLTDIDVFVNYFSSNVFSYISYWSTLCRKDTSANRNLEDCVRILSCKISKEEFRFTDSAETWKGYLAIARLFFQLNEYEEGAKMFLQALSVLPPGHEEEQAHIYNDVGECYYRLGRYDDVEPNYRMALDIRKKIYEKHPDLAESINNYGHIYFHGGRFDKALAHYEEAYEMWVNIPDGPHFGEADSLHNIALSLKNMGRDLEAESAFEKCAYVLDATKSANPFAVICRNSYGNHLETEGRYQQAEEQYGKAYDLLMQLYGPDYEPCAEQANKLAFFYFRTGRPDKAIPLFTEVEEVYTRIFGRDDLRTINALLLLGEVLLHSEGAAEALPVLKRVLNRLGSCVDAGRGMKARALLDMATAQGGVGEYKAALPFAQESIELREITESAGNSDSIKTYLLAIDCCYEIRDIRKMRAYIDECYEKHIKALTIDSDVYYAALIHMARLLRLAGYWERGKQFYEEVIATGESLLQTLSDRNLLKDNRVFNISVAMNELVFHEFQPRQLWLEAVARMEEAVRLMAEQENEKELANMQLNLCRARHYAGLPFDREVVRRAFAVLQSLGDPRAEKAVELLAVD